MRWINLTLARAFVLLDRITVTPVDAAARDAAHVYVNCLLARVRVPSLSAGAAEPIEEVVGIRAERYEPA